MKRARADHPVMKLNVGGKRFEVASETLAGMPFFEPMLQGRFPIARDEDGHDVFIDRCGDLFSILLQAHRTMQRPDQSLLDLHKTALLTECEYYGADHVAAMIRGETNPYHLRHEDRAIRQEEIAGNASLIDVFGTTFTDHHSEELQVPLLFKRGGNRDAQALRVCDHIREALPHNMWPRSRRPLEDSRHRVRWLLDSLRVPG